VDIGCCARTGSTLTGGGARSALKELKWFEGCGGGTDCEGLAEGEGGVGGATGTEVAGGTGWAVGVWGGCDCREVRARKPKCRKSGESEGRQRKHPHGIYALSDVRAIALLHP
jgi:hypothetical protein